MVYNNELFIKKAREIHGDKYDYSKVEYVNNRTKVCIICHKKDEFGIEHGEFWQTPWHHLAGEKCPKCVGKYVKTFKDFLEKSKLIHGNKYDYSKVNYVNTKTKVSIICPEHGEFWQTPECHVNRKQGCPVCGIKHQVKKRTLVLNDFIKRSNNIHNNKYDYSLVSFNNCKDKVDIICPTHGIFKQEVWGHLAGYGCPRCSIHESKSEQELFNLVKTNCPDTLNRVRNIIPPKEIDIYIPTTLRDFGLTSVV